MLVVFIPYVSGKVTMWTYLLLMCLLSSRYSSLFSHVSMLSVLLSRILIHTLLSLSITIFLDILFGYQWRFL